MCLKAGLILGPEVTPERTRLLGLRTSGSGLENEDGAGMTSFRPWEGVSVAVRDKLRLRFPRPRPPRPYLAVCVTIASIGGCAGSNGLAESADDVPPVTARYTLVTHESCNLTGEEVVREDANGDGKADVITVSEGGIKACQWLDSQFRWCL